jgi:hypothetical protein
VKLAATLPPKGAAPSGVGGNMKIFMRTDEQMDKTDISPTYLLPLNQI